MRNVDIFAFLYNCAVGYDKLLQYFQEWAKLLLKIHAIIIATLTRNVQNMKPVQNCTGFIFFTFHAVNLMTYISLFFSRTGSNINYCTIGNVRPI